MKKNLQIIKCLNELFHLKNKVNVLYFHLMFLLLFVLFLIYFFSDIHNNEISKCIFKTLTGMVAQ